MDNIRTVFQSLPNSIGAFTVAQDDFYTIVLNQNHSYYKNVLSYEHELRHILNGDFERTASVDYIEFLAHKQNGGN